MNPSSETIKKFSVCLVHDWLVAMRGGEKVLEAIAELYPEAPIYTLILDRKKLSPKLQKREIRTSFLQYIPGISKCYRWFLPLFPIAIWLMNVRRFDLVISSSHCVAKAVRTKPEAIHICYCHTPMRYLWGFSEEYLGSFPNFLKWMIKIYFGWLKNWDIKTSRKVTMFIANSKNTAAKINDIYDKPAKVIYPPVDVPNREINSKSKDYFLIVSALVPYKKIDLAIQVFNRLKQPLKIVGDGPERLNLERLIEYDGIKLEGWLDSQALAKQYEQCKALIFPGEEDFGIVPVEAQAYGKPVIAYGKGGALETVTQETGIFFYEQTIESLTAAVKKSTNHPFNSQAIKAHALSFSRQRFQNEIQAFIQDVAATSNLSSVS